MGARLKRVDPATVPADALFKCSFCEALKPAALMMLDHGRVGRRCKACRAAYEHQRHAEKKARAAYRQPGHYPCAGCEMYQACAAKPVPCARFRAYLRGEL